MFTEKKSVTKNKNKKISKSKRRAKLRINQKKRNER